MLCCCDTKDAIGLLSSFLNRKSKPHYMYNIKRLNCASREDSSVTLRYVNLSNTNPNP